MRSGTLWALVVAVAAAGRAEDWPTVAHDNRRTGFTRDSVYPVDPSSKTAGYRLKWHVDFKSFIELHAQPVVAGGVVYLGAQDGLLRAIDAETGREAWVFETAGPIMHSAAVAGGRVFFGSHDRNIYCLEAETGREVWRRKTGAGVWAAPLLDGGAVYIGSRDGVFYALDSGTGEERWRLDCGSPLRCPAACDEDTVYFGSRDMHAYAVEKGTGRVRWKRRLHGGRFFPYWPVVYRDVSIWMVQTYEGHMRTWAHNNKHIRRDVPQVQALFEYYEKFPEQRLCHALGKSDGKDAYLLPILRTVGNEGVLQPPSVDDRGDAYFIGFLKGDRFPGIGGLGQCQLIRFNLKNGLDWRRPGEVEAVADGFYGTYGHVRGKRAAWANWCTDETCVVSQGGRLVYTNHQSRAAAVDLEKNTIYRVAWYNGGAPERELVQFFGAEHNGPTKSPMAVVGDKVFLTWHVQFLLCMEGVRR